jgi:hypothetical protein
MRPMSIHCSEQGLILCDVFLKCKAVVLVGLLEPWLPSGTGHTCNVDPESTLAQLASLHPQDTG